MELRRLRLLVLSFAAVALLLPAAAHADPVLLMHANGTVTHVQNRFITTSATSPAPPAVARAPAFRPAAAKTKTKASSVTVASVLKQLYTTKAIPQGTYQADLSAWYAALAEEKQISKANSVQLANVTTLLHDIAAAGQMTASRLPVLFLTLSRNAQWWRSGPSLSYGQRVQFTGSNLEWEYYPGNGIELQVLGTFGEANGFYEAGAADYPKLQSLLAEMIPLAVQRGGGVAWEYYFNWEGGAPPWVSGMAQATGIEALTNAYKAFHQQSYLTLAHQALGILDTRPPSGVAVHGPVGLRFAQYDFAASTEIINADLQTLIGLDDYFTVSNDPLAGHLFREGNLQAAADVPAFNTGGWSLYQPGEADDLSYHQLVTGFLSTLCTQETAQKLVQAPVYCNTAKAFQGDLTTPPTLTINTATVKAKTGFHLTFAINRPAHVGVILTDASGKNWLYTSSNVNPGDDYWLGPKLPAGTYTVKMSATDLAGNYTSASSTLTAN